MKMDDVVLLAVVGDSSEVIRNSLKVRSLFILNGSELL